MHRRMKGKFKERGSAKSIMKNGGVLENEPVVDGIPQQRFWIDLTNVTDE